MNKIYVATCKKCGYVVYSCGKLGSCARHLRENTAPCDGEVICETPFAEHRRRVREGKELPHERLIRENRQKLKVKRLKKGRRIKKIMRVYISGAKTAGAAERFEEAEKGLRLKGYSVINPEKAVRNMAADLTEDEVGEVTSAMLAVCDSMYVLKGWENEEDVKKEIEQASNWDIPVEFER